MTQLFASPAVYELPLSRGGDLYVTLVYKPLVVDVDGEPILDGQGNRQYAPADFPDNSTISLVIDHDTPITIDGTIDGSAAIFMEDKAVVDDVKKGKLWRIVLAYDGGLDQVLVNGTVVRADGK
jgi:hypothetical protein